MRAGVWSIGYADRSTNPNIGASQEGVCVEYSARYKAIHLVYCRTCVAILAGVGRLAGLATEHGLCGYERPREDSGSGDKERRYDGGDGWHCFDAVYICSKRDFLRMSGRCRGVDGANDNVLWTCRTCKTSVERGGEGWVVEGTKLLGLKLETQSVVRRLCFVKTTGLVACDK